MKKHLIEPAIVFLSVLGCLFGETAFNRYVLMALPMGIRALCMFLLCWSIVIVPMIAVICRKYNIRELGGEKQNIAKQVLLGIAAGLALSLIFTLLPHLLGFGSWVDDGARYRYPWQYLYHLIYFIVGVGAAEEFVFRGYFYAAFRSACGREWIAVLCSSILFGLSHVFSGNILQVLMTTFLGVLFCLLRLKIRNFSLLSLILAHGIYDFLIAVCASLLLQ